MPLLSRVLQLMKQVIDEGRNAIRGMRSPDGNAVDLETAFSRIPLELACNTKIEDQIDFRISVDGTRRRLRPILHDEAYLIGREALVNAFRHSQARRIEVEVEYASRHLRVLVRDDGVGIDSQVLHSGREGHWGLVGIRERSKRIGADLRLRSRIGAGTEVELTVPGTIAFEKAPKGPLSRWFRWLSRERLETPKHDKGKRVH